jgi:hypothetical protein
VKAFATSKGAGNEMRTAQESYVGEIWFEFTLDAGEIGFYGGRSYVIGHIHYIEAQSISCGFNMKPMVLAEINIGMKGRGIRAGGGRGMSVT